MKLGRREKEIVDYLKNNGRISSRVDIHDALSSDKSFSSEKWSPVEFRKTAKAINRLKEKGVVIVTNQGKINCRVSLRVQGMTFTDITRGEIAMLEAMTEGEGRTLDEALPGDWWIENEKVSGRVAASLLRKVLISQEAYNTKDLRRYYVNSDGRAVLEMIRKERNRS